MHRQLRMLKSNRDNFIDDCLERMYDKINEIMNLSMNKDTKVKNISDDILAKMKGGYTNV